jgi:hypothetical protein
MLRIILLLGLTAFACGCARSTGEGDTTTEAPATDLAISVWHSGMDGPVQNWTLQCPSGGTLPRAAEACERLAELGPRAFAPTPRDVVCAQIYGGPQVAEVRGTFEGRAVDTGFTRRDSCEMERWERVAFLFPTG